MWFKIEDNTITETYSKPKAVLIGDIQYPQNIFNLWTESQLNDIGIYSLDSIDSTNRKDKKYYTNTNITYTFSGGKVTGSYGTPGAKNLNDSTDLEDNVVPGLKTQEKNIVDSTQHGLLVDSDWMAIRKSDTGEAIPTAWKTYRDSVRTKSDSFKTAIDAVSTVDELADITYDWPTPPTN